jgi:hypothetical protein
LSRHLKSSALLPVLLLIGSVAAWSLEEPQVEEPFFPVEEEIEVDPEIARMFPIPFASAHFLRDIQRVLLEEKILNELMTQTLWDSKNGLMWPTLDNGADVDLVRAEAYCEELEFAGHQDWRLPSIEELETLHRVMANATYKMPNEIRLSACCPWSSTRRGERSAWNYNFRNRKRFSGTVTYSYDHRALCVRTPGLEETPYDTQIPSRLYHSPGQGRRGG